MCHVLKTVLDRERVTTGFRYCTVQKRLSYSSLVPSKYVHKTGVQSLRGYYRPPRDKCLLSTCTIFSGEVRKRRGAEPGYRDTLGNPTREITGTRLHTTRRFRKPARYGVGPSPPNGQNIPTGCCSCMTIDCTLWGHAIGQLIVRKKAPGV